MGMGRKHGHCYCLRIRLWRVRSYLDSVIRNMSGDVYFGGYGTNYNKGNIYS